MPTPQITADQVQALVVQQVKAIADLRTAAALRAYLVSPRRCELAWDYGPVDSYPGFIVAEDPLTGIGIAYSQHGFGPGMPWILVRVNSPGFGMDCSAFDSLEGAFREGMA